VALLLHTGGQTRHQAQKERGAQEVFHSQVRRRGKKDKAINMYIT